MTAIDTRTGEIVESLSAAENDALADAEATIETGLKTFVEVGQALSLIRDSRLYRADYATFEAYCGARWHLSRPRAYQLIEAAEVVEALSTNVDTPLPRTESQARELSGLPAAEAAEAMRAAHEATAGQVTAKSIREARDAAMAKQVEADVKEFPALAFYAEQGEPDRVVGNAANLRTFDEPERERRLAILDKSVAADRKAAVPNLHVVPDAQEEARWSDAAMVAELAQSIAAIESSVTALAGDIDYDDLPAIEAAAGFLADLAAAVKEF